MRPTLRPGLQILRRDLRSIQLGLDWPGVATLEETPALRAVLAAIDGFRDAIGVVLAAGETGVSSDDAQTALEVLVECGAVVDQRASSGPDISASTWSALWLLAGPGQDAGDLLRKRVGCQIRVVGRGTVAATTRALLGHGQLNQAAEDEPADLLIVAADDEHRRGAADEPMREALPHVWVCVRDLVGVVGPFVVPGTTACIRCVDAARADLDPSWPVLVESADVRRLRAPACDPLLAHLVAAWAVQEAATWASGLRPQTWDRVIEVPLGFGVVQSETFLLHPRCGCGWPTWEDTMGA